MEFSLVIPQAVKRILAQKKTKELEKKKCSHCFLPCDELTKFICLGGSAQTIIEYIQKHPNEINELEKLPIFDTDIDDNLNLNIF